MRQIPKVAESLLSDGKPGSPHTDQVSEAANGGRHSGNDDGGEGGYVGNQMEMQKARSGLLEPDEHLLVVGWGNGLRARGKCRVVTRYSSKPGVEEDME